ncbi:branched-chain amino acid ABC transporter ATP-binding protein/permease [Polaromonas sp. P1(28)-8]|nr:branched-chain amino acid ABC transporter ATP-binding protein/permease [Polaromonas sp. P1(28)-8]
MSRFAVLAGWLVAAACLAVLPMISSGYVIYILNLLMVYLVLALGMHIVIGEAGQFSLAHAAFYGIGIYTAAILNNAFHFPFFVNVVAAGLLAAVVGLVISGLSLRMRDIYLALATFAFGEAMLWVLLNWESMTGGPNGLRFSPANLFGLEIASDKQAYLFVLGLTALFLWATLQLAASRLGSAFRAVRESEVAAMAMGINVKRTKMAAFTLSAFYAGCAGGMYTLFSSFIHPESLGFQTTILILTMVVVGGLGSVYGVMGGVIIFGLISEFLRQALSFQEIIYGVILTIFMMYICCAAYSRSFRSNTASGGSRMADNFLEVQGISVVFGGLKAVNNFSLSVEKGTIHALIGPNGAGKSTTFNCISRYYQPTTGRILLEGVDITHRQPFEMAGLGVARTFQNLELFNELTVMENVLLGTFAGSRGRLSELMSKPKAASVEWVAHLMESVGLTKYRDTKARNLDFGHQKLLELARAWALKPKLLLLDEPAAGLRNQEIETLDRLLRQFVEKEGMTVLLVEHVMQLVMSISDRVTVLSFGEKISEGLPDEVRNDAAVIEAYLGSEHEAESNSEEGASQHV